MGTFEAVYEGPWAATVGLAAIAVGAAVRWFRGQKFLVAYMALFTIVALGDALRSGPWSPLHRLPPEWEDRLGLLFVLAGDYRYFLVVARFLARPRIGAAEPTPRRAWAVAFGWMMIVPIVTYALGAISPRFTGRGSYLAYELQMIALVLVFRVVLLPRGLAAAPAAIGRWLRAVTDFELATYALWALADIVIFAGADAGFLLRIVPNVLYYGLFVWFVAARAPAEALTEPAT